MFVPQGSIQAWGKEELQRQGDSAIFLSDTFEIFITYDAGPVCKQPGDVHGPCSIWYRQRKTAVENKAKGNDVGIGDQRNLSNAADNCPWTHHTFAQQAVFMPPKSLCDCFTFDITKAGASAIHQGHSATDEWIFDLGWWLGTDP